MILNIVSIAILLVLGGILEVLLFGLKAIQQELKQIARREEMRYGLQSERKRE